ncbi:TetR/AcrR family transcriptional regulator [Actinoplanes sp. NPDC051470]|uniref:TetR/AcrR family transcriptional regulator n=1 Tax=Actinoplanes sp. NPDC051470 TaxID=3157224 RepID=UPI00342A6B04
MDIPLPPWRQPSPTRARAARPPLTRDQIVRAALRIVAAEGLDAVSMRRVAAEFDTGASSLYAHVANKDELYQLMFDEICRDIPIPAPDPARWQEQIKELARSGYEVMVRHGDVAKAAMAQIPTGPHAMRVSDAMFGLLLGAGMDPTKAGWALDRIFLYIVADAYENSLYLQRFGDSPERVHEYFVEFTGQLRDYYESLPASHYPHLRAHGEALTSGDGRQRFEFGLDMLVDGLARLIPAAPASE